MTYDKDPLLPMLKNEMEQRIAHFKGLTPEEEGKLLSLTPDQRRVIADLDRKYILLISLIIIIGLKKTTSMLLQLSISQDSSHARNDCNTIRLISRFI